jgi:hypothetical protein
VSMIASRRACHFGLRRYSALASRAVTVFV